MNLSVKLTSSDRQTTFTRKCRHLRVGHESAEFEGELVEDEESSSRTSSSFPRIRIRRQRDSR